MVWLSRILFSTIFLAGASAALAQSDAPDLTGKWVAKGAVGAGYGKLGHTDTIPKPKWTSPTATWTLDIQQQNGRGLIGVWGSKKRTENILGVIRRDGETVLFVDEDSYFQGTLLSPDTMELCLQETGESLVVACVDLKR